MPYLNIILKYFEEKEHKLSNLIGPHYKKKFWFKNQI